MSVNNKNKEEEESDDDFQYEEVSLHDDWSLTEGEEDLEATVKAIQERTEARAASITHQDEAVDVFLRNFLFQMNMTETLDCFQTEWTELVQTGRLDPDRVGVVPDVYFDNRRLESELRNAHREREELRQAASAAADTLVRVQRGRDLHRLQHQRVVQERNKLIEEVRKLKVQCSSYEPAVKRMNGKYQAVLKQTLLLTLDRDKTTGQSADAGETSVKGTTHPVIQPRPPSTPRSQSRVQPVKLK